MKFSIKIKVPSNFLILFYVNILLCLFVILLNQRQYFAIYFIVAYFLMAIVLLISYCSIKGVKINLSVPLLSTILYLPIFFSIINPSVLNWPILLITSLFPLVVYQVNFYFLQKAIFPIFFLKLSIILLVLLACYMVYTNKLILTQINKNSFQTNWSNVLGACLPLVFLIKKRSFQFLCLLFLGVFIILGLKRTGVFAYTIAILTFIMFQVKDNKVIFNLPGTLIYSIILIFIFNFLFNTIQFKSLNHAIKRIENISQDGGSGRGDLYSKALNNWISEKNTPYIIKIMGYGYGGFKRSSGMAYESAHNDVIDFAYDYGIFASFLLILYYVRLFYLLIIQWKKRNENFQFMLSTVIIFFIYSNFSALYHYFYFFIPLIISLSYIESLIMKQNKKIETLL